MQLGKMLIFAGICLIAAGIFFYFGGRLSFLGRLPGDIHFTKGNTDVYFPIVTCAVISVVATILLNLFFRR